MRHFNNTMFFICIFFISIVHADTGMFRSTPDLNGCYETPDITQPIVKWKFKTGIKTNRSTPLIHNGIVYVGSNDRHMYAIDLATGEQVWKCATGGIVASSPALLNDKIYFYSKDGYFYALNIADGTESWKLVIEAAPGGKDQYDYFTSSPSIYDSIAYIGSDQGTIYSIDLVQQDTLWTFNTTARVLATPAVDEDAVYIGSFDGFFYKLDKNTGEMIWKFDAEPNTWSPKGEVQASAVLADSFVCFGSRGEYFYVLRKTDGSLKWKKRSQGSWIVSSAAYQDGKLYYGDSDAHKLHAYDLLTGTQDWSYNTNNNIMGSPALTNSTVYFADGNSYQSPYRGKIYAFDRTTGAEIWHYTTNGNIWSSPVISDSVLCFGCDDGYIYALKNKVQTSVGSDNNPGPADDYSLLVNYPNPFNPSTTISYRIEQPGQINMSIYNIAGQELDTLVNEFQAAGQYNIQWRPQGLAGGLYFCKLETGNIILNRKLLLVK